MKYTGTLAKPIVRKRFGLLDDADTYKAEAMRVTNGRFEKLPDLFHAHGVAEYDYLGLVLAMANEHVPGFKLVNPAGRKTEWGIANEAEFRLDVDTIIEKNGLSVVEAIKLAIRLERWAAIAKPMKLPALEQHYYKADMGFVEVVKDARAFRALPAEVRNPYETIV